MKSNFDKSTKKNSWHYYFLLLSVVLAIVANAERLPTVGGDERSITPFVEAYRAGRFWR